MTPDLQSTIAELEGLLERLRQALAMVDAGYDVRLSNKTLNEDVAKAVTLLSALKSVKEEGPRAVPSTTDNRKLVAMLRADASHLRERSAWLKIAHHLELAADAIAKDIGFA